MPWRYLTALVFMMTSVEYVTSLFHSTGDPGGLASDLGDPGDLGDPAHHSTGCPPPDPTLLLQYRAVLLHLRSEGARRVVQLLRRRPRCPGTADVTAGLLREVGLTRLGGPLEVGRRAGWAPLDRWTKEAAEDVAVLVEDGELMMEAFSRKGVERWRKALWYAPGFELNSVITNFRLGYGYKVITTRVAVSRHELFSDVMESSFRTPNRNFDPRIGDVVSNMSIARELLQRTDRQRASNYSRPPLEGTEEPPSVLILRWAPPPPSQNTLLQVLRASPWLLAGVYRPDQVTVQPPAALVVQRSLLRSQLTAAGCATWRAELNGADPLTGVPLRLSYSPDTLPAVVALQGGGPLGVTVHCPELRATLSCGMDLERQTCRWTQDGHSTARRRRQIRRSYGRGRLAAWPRERRPRWRPAGSDGDRRWAERQAQHRTSRQAASGPHRSEGADQHRLGELGWSHPSVRRRATHDRQPWQKRHSGVKRADEEASADSSGATYPSEPKEVNYRIESNRQISAEHREANFPTEYAHPIDYTTDHIGPTYRDAYPASYGGATYLRRAQRRQYIADDVLLEVSPKLVSCGGAFGGCLLCAAILEFSSSKVPPEACIGPCMVGSGIACSGALATLHREIVKARHATARRDRRRG